MKVVTYYGPYRDFAGVKFPAKIIQYQDGHPSLDLTVTAVRANPSIDMQVPENVRTNPTPVKTEKVADGVWYITGGSHHSVLIEMKDYLVVVEGPQGDQRSMAVIAEVKKLVPNKPIKYLVNSHHHFDHSGGVRAYAAEGATIVTHELNRPLYTNGRRRIPGTTDQTGSPRRTCLSNHGRQHGAHGWNPVGGAVSDRRQYSS
jgi:hypothetical protein